MNSGNVFFFVAGALAVVAVLFIVYPWLAGRPRAALFSALPRWVPVAGIAAIAGTMALYLMLGSPQLNSQDSAPASAAAAMASPAKQASGAGSMDSAVAGLERRLAAGGGKDGDWELLAKSYEFMGRPDDAAAARQKRLPTGAGGAAISGVAPAGVAPPQISAAAAQLVTMANAARAKRDFASARAAYVKLAARNEMTADTWADYADVSASLNGNSLLGQPATFLGNALRLNPQHAKALWLQASMEHETHQYQAAVGSWQRLAAVLGPASEDAKLIAANLAEDQRLAGGSVLPAVAAGATVISKGVTVRGEVVLADALKGDRKSVV